MPSPLDNAKKIPKPPNSKGVKKNINPLGAPKAQDPFKNSFGVGAANPMGTPAANPMGTPQMDFGMGNMGAPAANPMGTPQMDFGMPSPTGGGGYENFMAGMMAPATQHGESLKDLPPAYTDPSGSGRWGIDDIGPIDQPTGMAGFSGAARGPGMFPGDMGGPGGQPDSGPWQPIDWPTDGDGRKMVMDDGRQRRPHNWYGQMDDDWFPRDGEGQTLPPGDGDPVITGMGGGQSPQVAGWDDPAMGGFPMDDPMMGDPMMGYAGGPQADFSGGSMLGPSMDSLPTVNQFGEEAVPSDSREYEEAMERELAQGGAYDEMPAVDPTVGLEEPLPDVQPPIEDTISPPEPDPAPEPDPDPYPDPPEDPEPEPPPEPQPEPSPDPPVVEQFAEVGEAAFEDEDEGDVRPGSPAFEKMKGTFWDLGDVRTAWEDLRPQAQKAILRGDTKLKQWVDKPEDPKEATPPTVEPVAPTVSLPPTSSAYPPMVRDESGNMVTDPDYQSGKKKDYFGGPAGMPMDSELEAEWREKNPDEPLPELDDTPEPVEPPSRREPNERAREGWGSISPDRKEPLYKKYGKARIEEYVKENNGNLPPFDEWDKEIQDKPALEEFKDKVDAGEVSEEEPIGIPPKEPVSEGAMQNAKNWDTVDGEYKFMGADYHKQNTRPEADTKDWEETREAAAEDIKEGDKFSGVGDAAYGADDAIGTASSESRSVAQEADAGGTAPIVSLPPTQPQTDAEYYDKLVNPDPFQNAPNINLPPGYGSQRVENGDEYYKFPGREYDVEPEEIFDEYGEPLMGSQGIDSNAGGLTVADVRRWGTTPAQQQALVNNAVAQSLGNYRQGLGARTGARPGMSSGLAEQAGNIGALVQQRMDAGQAQVDIPWQYAQQHADQVRQRRALAHKLGLDEASMITGDYYDYLGDRMATADIDNQIMRQMYGEMPDAFG